MKEKIILDPIGYVQTETPMDEIRNRHKMSQIIIEKNLVEALDGIQDFSHILVFFWMNRIPNTERRVKKVYPRGRKDMPLLGIFATRTPYRPNPLGMTLVRLLEVQGNILKVQGLDAFDGTPILDIKPFDPWDIAQELKVPEWWRRLETEKLDKHTISQ